MFNVNIGDENGSIKISFTEELVKDLKEMHDVDAFEECFKALKYEFLEEKNNA